MAAIVVRDDEIDARYMLASTLVITFALVCLQGWYCITGNTETTAPWLYVIPMLIMLIANVIALVAVKYSILVSAYGFCTLAEGVIVFMVLVSGEQSLPSIALVMLPTCAYGLAYFVTTKQMLPFLVMTVAALFFFGIWFGNVDDAIPSIMASVVGSMLVSRLRTQLYKLRGAIRILVEHGRQNNEEHLRRITGAHKE